MLGCVFGTMTVPMSHDASVMMAANATTAAAPRLKANRDTGRRKNGELGDRLSCRRRFRVVEHVQENVLCVVCVHDAEIRRDRRAAHAICTSHVHVEALSARQPRAVAWTAHELGL